MVSLGSDRSHSLLKEATSVIAFDQPKLAASIFDTKVVVEGTYLVVSSDIHVISAGPLSEYEVSIEIDPRYPTIEPKVKEVGGRIPWENKYHVNRSGDCCVIVWEAWCTVATDTSFTAYFSGPLNNFFLSQYVFEELDVWPFGDLKHGIPGLVQEFSDVLCCTEDADDVHFLLEKLSTNISARNMRRLMARKQIKLRNAETDLSDLRTRISQQNAKNMLKRLIR